MTLHLAFTLAALLYLLVAILVWAMAGRDASEDMETMRHETEIFNSSARNAGHMIPPQAPLSISYQNIFWQGLVWPAYFSAKKRK